MITRAIIVGILGGAEGFSAEAVNEQLAIRNAAVKVQLDRYRRAKGIAIKVAPTK